MMLKTRLKFKFIGKSNLATLSASLYTLLCAIVFFCVWLYDEDINAKIITTLVMAICTILAILAMLAKLHGTFTQSIKTSFLFGIFVVIFASLITYLCISGMVVLAFFAFIAILLASLGTYFLVLSAKK